MLEMKKFELPLLQQRERKKNSRNKKEEKKITTKMILVSIGQLTVNFFCQYFDSMNFIIAK